MSDGQSEAHKHHRKIQARLKTHADLIDRLKADHGADRELDADVWCAFQRNSRPALINGKCLGWVLMGENCIQHRTPTYTESLDACIGLMREVLPEYYRLILIRHEPKLPEGEHWSVGAPVRTNKGVVEINACHEDLCRALLIAILQAVEETG